MTLRYRYKRPTFLFDTCLYSVCARQHWCTVARPLRGFVPKKSNFCFLLCVQERQQRQRAPKQIRTAACLLPCLFASAALHFWRHAVDSGMDATDITRNTPCGESALLYACWLISRAIILLGRKKKKKRFICKIHRHQLVPGNRLENFRDNTALFGHEETRKKYLCVFCYVDAAQRKESDHYQKRIICKLWQGLRAVVIQGIFSIVAYQNTFYVRRIIRWMEKEKQRVLRKCQVNRRAAVGRKEKKAGSEDKGRTRWWRRNFITTADTNS